MSSPQHQLLQRLPNIVYIKQGMEAAHVPVRPAPVAPMAQRLEGRNAAADHDRRTAPDPIAGLSDKY